MNKTNAMRQLEKAGIEYTAIEYEVDENDLSGMHIAEQTGLDPNMMFKTLVAKGERLGPLVFCLPVNAELDPVKELLGLTGYIRGGCSPVGMKKRFPTFFDETVVLFDEVTVSAGVRGCQLKLSAEKLIGFLNARTADITEA